MILINFFKEIKNRFILTLFSWFFTLATCYIYKKNLLFFIFHSNNKIFIDNCFYFITTDVTDVLAIYLTLSCFITNQLTFVYIVYNVIIFISPGLYEFEHNKIKTIVKLLLFVIFSNLYFTNEFFLPIFWSFFYNFQVTDTSIPMYFEAKITEYVDFYIFLYYSSGVIFLFYTLCYYLMNYLIYDTNLFKKLKKTMLVSCFILATLVTPPDILSQVIVGLLLFILNECIVIILIFKMKKRLQVVKA